MKVETRTVTCDKCGKELSVMDEWLAGTIYVFGEEYNLCSKCKRRLKRVTHIWIKRRDKRQKK